MESAIDYPIGGGGGGKYVISHYNQLNMQVQGNDCFGWN
jgi:hypothetical protein